MFNTREYEWSDVTVVLAGQDVIGLRGISYSSAQEKEALYAKGNKPHGIQSGNKAYTGSIRLLQSELEALTMRWSSRLTLSRAARSLSSLVAAMSALLGVRSPDG